MTAPFGGPAAEDAVKVLEAELGDPRPRITAAVQQGGAR